MEVKKCLECGKDLEIWHDGKSYPLKCNCQKEQEQAEEIRKNTERLADYRKIAIPNPLYRTFTFEKDDGKEAKVIDILKRYVKKFKEIKQKGLGLLFYGGIGTGKTFYAHCVANALITDGYKVASTSLSNVIKIAQKFKDGEQEFLELMRNDAIVLDDVGAERQTSFSPEPIYNFINECTTRNIILLVTTNFTLKEFQEASQNTADLTNARIYSRLLEKCYPVKINTIRRREEIETKNKQFMKDILFGE